MKSHSQRTKYDLKKTWKAVPNSLIVKLNIKYVCLIKFGMNFLKANKGCKNENSQKCRQDCTFVKPFWKVNKQDVSKFIWNSLDLSIPLFELQPKESIIHIFHIPSSQLHQTSLTKVYQ